MTGRARSRCAEGCFYESARLIERNRLKHRTPASLQASLNARRNSLSTESSEPRQGPQDFAAELGEHLGRQYRESRDQQVAISA